MGRPDEIRAVAIALFAERGYRGTSMKDIATALSMQAPSLYNHVDAKETLLRDVILETLVELQAEIDAIVAVEADPVVQLLRMTEAHVLYHAQHPAKVQIGNRELHNLDEPWYSDALDRRKLYRRTWEEVIQRGITAERFDVPSPKLATFAILEMGIGVANWFKEDGDLGSEAVASHFGDMALRLLGVVPDRSLLLGTAGPTA